MDSWFEIAFVHFLKLFNYNVIDLTQIYNSILSEGKEELCKLLVQNGAKTDATNSVKRTPSAMAAFVGNHNCVAVINNFVPKVRGK